MKITVYGAGAVGGLIAARLADGDDAVSVIARGATLTAIRTHGLRLQRAEGLSGVPVRAEDDPARLGPQDLVILAVKTTGLEDVAQRITPLLGENTIVVTAMNGVPWWFFSAPQTPYAGLRLHTLDPTGRLAQAIPLAHLVGCVVHLSSSTPAPGIIAPGSGNRLILGEASGGISSRVKSVVELMNNAGFEALESADIRQDIWYKLWGNMTMNPLSAISGATGDRVLADPLVAEFCLRAMQEAARIGQEIGCPITQTGEERMGLTRKLGAFKTSMLQDVEAAKQLEIDALVGAVQEIGKQVGIKTPNIDSLLGMVRLFARSHGLYPNDVDPG